MSKNKNNVVISKTLWYIIVVAILAGYIYGVFQGLEGSWWRIFSLFASGIFFTFIVLKVNTYIIKRASR